jgi:hypothetical protein
MAENAPKIVGALGYNGRVYRTGLEKELAAAAKAGNFDLAPFVSEAEGDGRPLIGNWASPAAKRVEADTPTVYVQGVDFASDAAGEAAKAAGLTAADFEGVKASGATGYTKPDVAQIVAAKAEG